MVKVFLSSTGKDLWPHREAVYAALESPDFHCVRMEDFPAADWETDAFCRAQVGTCDLFVGLIGHRYGSSPKHSRQSYTEREYDAAVAAGKPRLMFVAPDGFAGATGETESKAKQARQRAFRRRVWDERLPGGFGSPDQLASRVMKSVANWAYEQALERTAPATGSGGATIPLPPQPYFAHPYPLQDHFTGRREERRTLTEWLTSGTQGIFAYVALGGFGKSALTWAWVQRGVLGLPLPGMPDDACDADYRLPDDAKPGGVLWWSFYEREAKFDAFLREALVYCSGGQADPASLNSDHDRVVALVNLLQQHRFLLVLDGFERELRAYASLNASYQGDDVAEEPRADHRACIDPRAADFLRRLAALPLQSRVLMTTRLFPRELEGHGGATLPACRREDLTALHPEDAVAFFRAQGIKGHHAEIEAACSDSGFHPLALRLLAGMILNDPERPGDVDAAKGYDPCPELVAREHHVLQLAYDALRPDLRELLSRLAAFRGPVEYEAAKAISPLDDEAALKPALRELTERGLLLFDRAAVRHDLHPIVRRYAYDRLTDKEGVHTRLQDYWFWAVPQTGRVERMEDLAPVIELYHHTIGAGRHDDACHLFYNRLATPLLYQLAAYHTCVELVRGLLPNGEACRPQLASKRSQSWSLNVLAVAYGYLGQPRRMVALQEMANAIDEAAGDAPNLAIGLRNLAVSQAATGCLHRAEGNLRRSIALSAQAKHGSGRGVGCDELGRLLARQGAFEDARHEIFDAAEAFKQSGELAAGCTALIYLALVTMLMGDANEAREVAHRARTLADSVGRVFCPVERNIVQAEWLLGWSCVALAAEHPEDCQSHLLDAETHLTEALSRCCRSNMVDHEPDILLAWARWHRLKGNADEARTQAEEALYIADRCEYRLCQADMHNFLALLDLEAGNLSAAREHAETAKERAYCDGPPHYYKPAYDEAERLLAELAARGA
jgi:hypothetical protein